MTTFGDTRLPDRFWDRLQVNNETNCWLWTGTTQGRDKWMYGKMKLRGTLDGTHRHAYRELKGNIPAGYQIDHLCRQTLCCNPEHLEIVTQQENARRGNSGKFHADKTHCPQGHPYSPQNTLRTNTGCRKCRACAYERQWLSRKGTLEGCDLSRYLT